MLHFTNLFLYLLQTKNIMLSNSGMKLLTISGNQQREVVDKANALGIEKDQIVSINQNGDGTFTLYYYGED